MDLSKFHPSRRGLIRGVLMASGFAPALLAALGRATANSKVPVVPGVQELNGDVRINARSAAVGQPVHPGDLVATGSDGSCVIIIGEHVFLIRESSEIEFYEDYFEEGLDTSLSGRIRILAGAMLSVFAKTDTTIATQVATIGIRGTACYVSVEAERTYACVCYGRGDLSGAQDGLHLESVTTTYHDSPRYIYPLEARQRIEKAPMIDHKDDELRMLEALVNRRPPFDGERFRKKRDGY